MSESMQQHAGALLQQRREALGLTTGQVAAQLNLKSVVIEQIEQLRFDKSVAPTFIRGYLRHYARLLKLDENQVLAQFDRYLVANSTPAIMQSFSRKTSRDAAESRFMLATYILLILLIGMSLIWFWQTHLLDRAPSLPVAEMSAELADIPALNAQLATLPQTSTTNIAANEQVSIEHPAPQPESQPALSSPSDVLTGNPSKLNPVASVATQQIAESAAVNSTSNTMQPQASAQVVAVGNDLTSASSIAARATEPTKATEQPSPQAGNGDSVVAERADGEVAAQTKTKPSVTTEASVVTVDSQATAMAPAAHAVGQIQIQLSVSGDCWVELVDNQQQRLAYQMLRAGSQLQLQGAGPLQLVLGDPSVVQVTANGQPIDLSAYKPQKVAKLTLNGSQEDVRR